MSASPGALPAAIRRADERIAEGLRAGGVPFRLVLQHVHWIRPIDDVDSINNLNRHGV